MAPSVPGRGRAVPVSRRRVHSCWTPLAFRATKARVPASGDNAKPSWKAVTTPGGAGISATIDDLADPEGAAPAEYVDANQPRMKAATVSPAATVQARALLADAGRARAWGERSASSMSSRAAAIESRRWRLSLVRHRASNWRI